MILCECDKNIDFFVAIAQESYRTGRPIIVSGGAHFVCEKCANRIIASWEEHNVGRVEPYLIQCEEIIIEANTKKDFAKWILPQLIRRFRPKGWYIPKSDIRQALNRTKKRKKEYLMV